MTVPKVPNVSTVISTDRLPQLLGRFAGTFGITQRETVPRNVTIIAFFRCVRGRWGRLRRKECVGPQVDYFPPFLPVKSAADSVALPRAIAARKQPALVQSSPESSRCNGQAIALTTSQFLRLGVDSFRLKQQIFRVDPADSFSLRTPDTRVFRRADLLAPAPGCGVRRRFSVRRGKVRAAACQGPCQQAQKMPARFSGLDVLGLRSRGFTQGVPCSAFELGTIRRGDCTGLLSKFEERSSSSSAGSQTLSRLPAAIGGRPPILLRRQILKEFTLKRLKSQALAPKWKIDSAGRRVVEQKADTKKRLGRSPDDMDAFNLAYYEFASGAPEIIEVPILDRPTHLPRPRPEVDSGPSPMRPRRKLFGR